ncbi:unnamed protein product, partial [Iphiclides podalirius]
MFVDLITARRSAGWSVDRHNSGLRERGHRCMKYSQPTQMNGRRDARDGKNRAISLLTETTPTELSQQTVDFGFISVSGQINRVRSPSICLS